MLIESDTKGEGENNLGGRPSWMRRKKIFKKTQKLVSGNGMLIRAHTQTISSETRCWQYQEIRGGKPIKWT